MSILRAFLLTHRPLAALLLGLALCMKLLLPAGTMLASMSFGSTSLGGDTRRITVQICADSLGRQLTRQIEIGQQTPSDTKPDSACAFSVLADSALGGADPVLLALALVYILALAFAPLLPTSLQPVSHLRPPLRGPPALIG